MGPRALWTGAEISPPPGFDYVTVKPVARFKVYFDSNFASGKSCVFFCCGATAQTEPSPPHS